MSATPPEPAPPDLAHPDEAMAAVAAASLRLMAGSVSRRTMEQLQRTVQQSPAEYPWQVVTQVILAEPADPQRLVQQGLQAQRDWVLRGGREVPRPLGNRAKGLLARFCAQAIFLAVYALILVAALLLLKHKMPDFDIYRVLAWLQGLFGTAR